MLWANWGHFYATRAFSRSVIFICFQKKQSILMLRRHKQNHRAPTFHNHCFEQFQEIQFSAPVFGRGATPAPGGLEL